MNQDLISLNIPFLTLVTFLVTTMAFIISLLFDKRRQDKKQGKLFSSLSMRFKKGLIKDKEDILISMRSYFKYSTFSLASVLEDYLVWLEQNEPDNKGEDSILSKYYLDIKKYIEEDNKEKPFGKLPELERRLLRSIHTSVKNKDYESINENLEDLNSLFESKNRDYKFSRNINWVTIPLAIVGVIITLYFGFQPAVDYERIDKSIKDNIHNISILTDIIK